MNIITHKYPYAINDDGKPIYIEEVTQENRRHTHYHCYGCGAELFPVLGNHREHHFRHEKDAICDPDKYLHEYAKAVIKRRFDENETFEIQYNAKLICKDSDSCRFFEQFNWKECERDEALCTFNLKEYYDTCVAEKGYYQEMPDGKKKYIADLLLTNSQNPDIPATCIEIWVTHECTEDKKQNGGRIIEIKVTEEADANRPIIESDDIDKPIRFYNFPREQPFDATKMFRHLKLLPGLNGKVVVTDISTCREKVIFDPKASLEIIFHENVRADEQEIVYAYYCNEHGVRYIEQRLCEFGKKVKNRNRIISFFCPYVGSNRKCPCPCPHFKYSHAKGEELKAVSQLYWTQEDNN